MNDCELNIRMSDEEIERIKELLTKDKSVRHYLLKISNNQELDVIEYKEYENLQQRIDKLNKYMKEHSYDYVYQDCKFNETEQYEDIKSILQGEEVK